MRTAYCVMSSSCPSPAGAGHYYTYTRDEPTRTQPRPKPPGTSVPSPRGRSPRRSERVLTALEPITRRQLEQDRSTDTHPANCTRPGRRRPGRRSPYGEGEMRPTPANTSRNNGIMHGTPTHVVRSLKRPLVVRVLVAAGTGRRPCPRRCQGTGFPGVHDDAMGATAPYPRRGSSAEA